ncbi:FAD-dependent monooxygenase [Streptomyces qinzhouensis]|uniref:FAD-binding protein n=1 Tax=Streptomyces qinzhouensis TaxID=2599401 RepID=A0A5B8J5P8_9ACTN|nr:FAD-dependent monooxygenase [Streptomyces qinzhouensis]QDY75734.1 FAD-binding protein [Streptomyces qinzhouensis]
MPKQRAIVIGGGIGGLTAAVALHRSGRQVTVLERAASLDPVGAGIALAPNAQRALDTVGLGDEIRSLAAWQGDGGLRDPAGRWLIRMNSDALAARFGGPVVLLHRATLIERLLSRLPDGTVRTGSPARLTDPGSATGRPARVAVPDGGTETEMEADIVVGADGIHSAVRRVLFPGHPGPRYSGLTTWRIVVTGVDGFDPHETWGPGRIWGSHLFKDGRAYAYAAAVAPEGEHADDERAELLRRYGDWHDPIPRLIAAATDGVLRHDVHHMIDPLPAFHRGRTVLVGDAAHAMAPSLGQGGNQAVEDAVVLAHHCAGGDLGAGLAAYTTDRLPRTARIVRRAARVFRLHSLTSLPAVTLRDGLMALTARLGPGAAVRAFDGIADWRPPHRTYAEPAPDGADGDGTRRLS